MTAVTSPLRPPRLVLPFAGGDGKTMRIKINYIYINLGVEIINSKRQVKRKLVGHAVQIRVCRKRDA